jgi:hypothetical protein
LFRVVGGLEKGKIPLKRRRVKKRKASKFGEGLNPSHPSPEATIAGRTGCRRWVPHIFIDEVALYFD